MPKLLDRGNGRASYFGGRTAEKRLFIDARLALPNLWHEELLACHPVQWAHLVKKYCIVNGKQKEGGVMSFF